MKCVLKMLTLPMKQSQHKHYWRSWHVICEDRTPPQNLDWSPPAEPPVSLSAAVPLSHKLLCIALSHIFWCIVKKTILLLPPLLRLSSSPNSHPSHILFSVSTGCREILYRNEYWPNIQKYCWNRQTIVACEQDIYFKLALLPISQLDCLFLQRLWLIDCCCHVGLPLVQS